ncbi:cysteine proteinase [Sporormia fimetaria CBS 119925]|uniref:Ubiquitin carboxyl-terminal hydrolase n=1 Tax=Sporormia fimetaria CBS 119925 TaxID=1340428 RepID=A0A6A6VJA8_9PLEO|nr:cysteine proteinase [Sporormia fimetaria CBS 119925]
MTSFFGRFKPGTSPASPATNAVQPVKRDPNAPQPTPLEKLLGDAGPIRPDGSDKFFGYENFGSTCYCNSIIQSLYYSVPFREQVINFPCRSPPEALERPPTAPTDPLKINTDVPANGANSALSPKGRNSMSSPNAASPRKSTTTPGGLIPPPPMQKPEDNKDSPEYKKKQALAAGPVLAMDYENSKAYGMSESLFTCLKDIFEAVIAHKSRMGVVSPNKFLEILRRENEMFRTPMHQDAHEFLNLLLNEVVDNVEKFSKQRITEGGEETSALANGTSLPASNNTGWVHELFEGTLTSETRCLTCENTSQRDEAFLDLSVDLEQHSSVTSCLRKFSEEEMLCERNKFHCDNCGGLQEAEKRMKIKRLPRILALHLKRFKYTEDLQRLQKLFHRVVYPYYLRLFNTTDDAEDPDRLYELYAVVVHIGGGPYHGHYVSIIKTQDRGWLLFDDEMVEPVDKAYVRNFFGGEGVLACAYVLFYQETTLEAMQKEMEAEGLAAAQQASTTMNEEGIPQPVKSNANGVGVNGHVPGTPSLDLEEFVNLNHAHTAPPVPVSEHAPLESTLTSLPGLSSKKSRTNLGALGRKEKEKKKEEKERKAAEKEAEKMKKQKRKEAEQRLKEEAKRADDELRKALEASRQSAAMDEERRKATAATATTTTAESTPPHSHPHTAPADPLEKVKEKEKENTTFGMGSLSRFRHSSMSLRGKPKFWAKDKDKSEDKEGNTDAASTSRTETEDEKTEEGRKNKSEKNRFSLGRKKSTFRL